MTGPLGHSCVLEPHGLPSVFQWEMGSPGSQRPCPLSHGHSMLRYTHFGSVNSHLSWVHQISVLMECHKCYRQIGQQEAAEHVSSISSADVCKQNHCPIRPCLQNKSSKIKLSRISKWWQQSIKPRTSHTPVKPILLTGFSRVGKIHVWQPVKTWVGQEGSIQWCITVHHRFHQSIH